MAMGNRWDDYNLLVACDRRSRLRVDVLDESETNLRGKERSITHTR